MISKIPKDLSKEMPSHSHSKCAQYSTTAFSVFKSFNFFDHFNTYVHKWGTSTMLKKVVHLWFKLLTILWTNMSVKNVIESGAFCVKIGWNFHYFNWHTYQWSGFSDNHMLCTLCEKVQSSSMRLSACDHMRCFKEPAVEQSSLQVVLVYTETCWSYN